MKKRVGIAWNEGIKENSVISFIKKKKINAQETAKEIEKC